MVLEYSTKARLVGQLTRAVDIYCYKSEEVMDNYGHISPIWLTPPYPREIGHDTAIVNHHNNRMTRNIFTKSNIHYNMPFKKRCALYKHLLQQKAVSWQSNMPFKKRCRLYKHMLQQKGSGLTLLSPQWWEFNMLCFIQQANIPRINKLSKFNKHSSANTIYIGCQCYAH